MALQPKLPPPRGQIMDLVNFIRTPRVSVPLILCLTLVVDLPMAYLTSGNVNSRRWWSRLMMMIPLGIGLAAAGGFAVLYFLPRTLHDSQFCKMRVTLFMTPQDIFHVFYRR